MSILSIWEYTPLSRYIYGKVSDYRSLDDYLYNLLNIQYIYLKFFKYDNIMIINNFAIINF